MRRESTATLGVVLFLGLIGLVGCAAVEDVTQLSEENAEPVQQAPEGKGKTTTAKKEPVEVPGKGTRITFQVMGMKKTASGAI